jgi:adenylate kinase
MHKYIIIGPQGCGKGTQAKLLAADHDFTHISVGDIFRWHIQQHTKVGSRIKRLVASGGLVPDTLVEELVKARLEQHDWHYGFILDGFPRNLSQAEFFLENYNVNAVILLDVLDSVVEQRIANRWLCRACGRDYNRLSSGLDRATACAACGGPLVQRSDDTPSAIRQRLADYHAQTEPILELFRRRGLLLTVDGTRSPAEVQQDIRRRLGLDCARGQEKPLTSDAWLLTPGAKAG